MKTHEIPTIEVGSSKALSEAAYRRLEIVSEPFVLVDESVAIGA